MTEWGRRARGTLPPIIEGNAETRPGKVGFYCEGQPVTYGEIHQRSTAWANRYAELGVEPGDRVAVFMPNSPDIVSSWFATAKLGAIHVPINTALHGEFLAHQLRVADPKIVVVHPRLASTFIAAAGAAGNLRHLVIGGDAANGQEAEAVALPGVQTLSTADLASGEPNRLPTGHRPAWDEVNAILFTSGTTGLSKGVAMCQNYLLHIAHTIARNVQFDENSIWFQPSPLFHINASLLTVLMPSLVGGTGCTDLRFSASQYWDRVRHYGATHISFLTYARIVWNRPEQPDDPNNSVRIVGGTVIPAEIHHGLERRFGLRIIKNYALSEACAAPIMSTADDPAPPQYSGRANPDFEVKLFDDTDEEVPPGQTGEIVIRPRAPGIMFSGYYNNPAATADAWRNGWFHTGDLGRATSDGWFSFVDRKKDYIRRRGENISSYEVETVLSQHPALDAVAVHGVPSELGEDEVKACLVAAPGAEVDVAEFLEFCEERLPSFAVPRYVEVLSDLPRNQVGRVLKAELRARGVTDATWDRETEGGVPSLV